MIPVGRLAPKNQWDTTLLDALIDGQLYPHGLDVRRCDGYPLARGCALVVPGRYWHDRVDLINHAVKAYDWLLLVRTSDEEDLFDVSLIDHPNARFWVQTPRTDRSYGNARLFGVGFTPHFADLPPDPPAKSLDVFLAAQDTHQRRHEAFAGLQRGKTRKVIATAGFTQGLEPGEYAAHMVNSKVAPAPAGPASPDSFRTYEALEAHAIPIADDITPGYDSVGYWQTLFPDCPFPVLANYRDLSGYCDDQLFQWPTNANRIAAWWMRQKREYVHWFVDDLKALGAL